MKNTNFFLLASLSLLTLLVHNNNLGAQDCDLLIYCPANVRIQPTESILPSRTGEATSINTDDDCGLAISISYVDELSSDNECNQTIYRMWSAENVSGTESRSCVQTITRQDFQHPFFNNFPNDIVRYVSNEDSITTNECTERITWMAPQAEDNHRIKFINRTTMHNDEIVDLKSGDFFPFGLTTVDYYVEDYCGNNFSRRLTINVICTDCVLVCPDDIHVDFNVDMSPENTGSPSAFDGRCGSLDSISYTDELDLSNCLGNLVYERRFHGVFADYPDRSFSCLQRITTPSLVILDCPVNQVVADNTTNVYWEEPVALSIPSSNRITLTSNYSSGSTFPQGNNIVTFTARDICGNIAQCSFEVRVEADLINTSCSRNITIEMSTDEAAILDFDLPTYDGLCESCPSSGFINGFVRAGSFEGSEYYLSRDCMTYPEAQIEATNRGGHLATIQSSEENAYIAKELKVGNAFIGLSDVLNEGQFVWEDGSELSYTNWYSKQPNNYNNQDFVAIMKSGYWNDMEKDASLSFVMEKTCNYVQQESGPALGSLLAMGSYTSIYKIEDGCGYKEYCVIDIEVVRPDITVGSIENPSKSIDVELATKDSNKELETTISLEELSNKSNSKLTKDLSSALKLYPNPARDILFLECSTTLESVQVISQQGQEILSQSIEHYKELDISALTKGIYFLRAITKEGERIVERFIKA